jgi:hypothetical protein
MAEYIHKLRAAARVSEPGEEPLDGFFSLSPVTRTHRGPETLLERLNAPERVLPFHRAEDEAVLLLNRLEIEWVRPAPSVDPDRISPGTFQVTREERVRVRLASGETLEGVLRMELPEWINRVSDFMNGEEDFFPLACAEGMMLINKHHVAHVHLFESSPSPIPDRH